MKFLVRAFVDHSWRRWVGPRWSRRLERLYLRFGR